MVAGPERRARRAGKRGRTGEHRITDIETDDQSRQRIKYCVRRPDYRREHSQPDQDSQRAARYACNARVEYIFERDRELAVAQRL
ncbi:hypothetical protein SDC9_201562 [bioreactor metagenome]|uniref:Uncharacterized protein n=1 Tax=bioreactor metagenome TaxID=1076179 RepID=A0A645J071_9ZZZZ